MLKIKTWILVVILVWMSSCRKGKYDLPDIQILRDGTLEGETIVLKKGTDYYLDGKVFINDGQTLLIEPGVIIRAKTRQGINASTLIISRGAKVIAEGEPENPIIFTVEGDDLEGAIPIRNKGLWGGVIILGNAPINTISGEAFIEGISETDPRGVFGGSNPYDNSGVLRYVSIRYGGTNIGEGNEINGLTLGGVGSGTVIENVEVISNLDDGIEIFGGNVNLRNIVVAFCGDDAIDIDYGYRGRIQYVFVIQEVGIGDKIIEANESSENFFPYTKALFANGTFIGRGSYISNHLISCSGVGGVSVYNSIFINQRYGIEIENTSGNLSSFQRFMNGEFEFRGNIFWNVAENHIENIFSLYGVTDSVNTAYIRNYASSMGNFVFDAGLFISETLIKPIPRNPLPQPFPINSLGFDNVNFSGAFGVVLWLAPWSVLWKAGIVTYH